MIVAPELGPLPQKARESTATLLPLDEYEKVVVSFSGGKDSIATVLHLLELGLPRENIELWHQCIDGTPGVDQTFFDWPVTESYVKAFASAMDIPVLFQWKVGGFAGELMRNKSLTKPSEFQTPDGRVIRVGGERGKIDTRMQFPAPSRDLRARWCTAYCKIDPDAKVYANDPRFKRGCLVCECTGERRQESGNRATYARVEPHKANRGARRIEHWRPVLEWKEQEVWDILARWNINPHPCYRLGWSRCSCIACIFGDPRDFASLRVVDRELFQTIERLEAVFGKTIKMPKKKGAPGTPIGEWADRECVRGKGPYLDPKHDARLMREALGQEFDPRDIFVRGAWDIPRGAFGHSGGPV